MDRFLMVGRNDGIAISEIEVLLKGWLEGISN
jgi:hypothetical protein